MHALHRWLSDLLNLFFPKSDDAEYLWPWHMIVLIGTILTVSGYLFVSSSALGSGPIQNNSGGT